MTGLFISFEGIDGCGKTTQLALFRKFLLRRHCKITVTREPGGTCAAEQIRAIILDPATRGLSDRAELLLYLAARAQHVDQVIAPALKKGHIVLCDRFADATFAYQGGGRSLSAADIHAINRFACKGLAPDLTFLFDLTAKKSLERVMRGRRRKDRMEREGVRFLEKVRKTYLALTKADPGRIRVIDASSSPDAVHEQVLREWQKWVCKKAKKNLFY